jgi:hypothetical protein
MLGNQLFLDEGLNSALIEVLLWLIDIWDKCTLCENLFLSLFLHFCEFQILLLVLFIQTLVNW